VKKQLGIYLKPTGYRFRFICGGSYRDAIAKLALLHELFVLRVARLAAATTFFEAVGRRVPGHLLERKLSPSTQKLGLSPLRKLAREMSENGLLDPGIASAIERTKGVKQEGVQAGNWLLKEQANELLNAPDPSTLKGSATAPSWRF
jgi:hypothetical protein